MERTRLLKIITLMLISILFFACSSAKKIKAPPLEVRDSTLSRSVDDRGAYSSVIDETNTFYTYDREVYSSVWLLNLSGEHKIKWEWIKPDGNIYYSTENMPLQTKPGFYKNRTMVWHKMHILGDNAAELPGRWTVNVYLDNGLIATNHFELIYKVNIEIMPYYSKKPDPSKWGLIIGVENYRNLPTAKFAEKDALLVKEYFLKIIGVPYENLIQLYETDATGGKIKGFLKSYLPLNTNKDSTLYVYFSGHGVPGIQEDGEPYLATYDSDARFIEHTGYKLNTFYSDINSLDIKESYIFIDSCFSGFSSRSEKMLLSDVRPALIKIKEISIVPDKIISFNASEIDQLSNSYEEKEHGLFTYFLLEGIRGLADINNDKEITIKELFQYVKANVVRVSNRKGIPQTPVALFTNKSVENLKIADVLR